MKFIKIVPIVILITVNGSIVHGAMPDTGGSDGSESDTPPANTVGSYGNEADGPPADTGGSDGSESDGPPASTGGSDGSEADSLQTLTLDAGIVRRQTSGLAINIFPHLPIYIGRNEERLEKWVDDRRDIMDSLKTGTVIGEFQPVSNGTALPENIVLGPEPAGRHLYHAFVVDGGNELVSLHQISAEVTAPGMDHEFDFSDWDYSPSRQGLTPEGEWISSGDGDIPVTRIVMIGVSGFFETANQSDRADTLQWVKDRSPYPVKARVFVDMGNEDFATKENTVNIIDNDDPFRLTIRSGDADVILTISAVGQFQVLGATNPNGPWSKVKKVQGGEPFSVAKTPSRRFFTAQRVD